MKNKKFNYLTSLLDINLTRRECIKVLDLADSISGHDLFHIINLIIRNKFSGNLVIISESDEISGIQFIKGNISKIDLQDQDSSLGALMVQDNLIKKDELQELIGDLPEKKSDIILIENKKLTEPQVIQLLLKQTNLRLLKFIQIANIRVNFNLEENKQAPFALSDVHYYKILYNLIYRFYKDEWIQEYKSFYSLQSFSIYLSDEALNGIQNFQLIHAICEKLIKIQKSRLSYTELITGTDSQNDDATKLVHFLVLAGFIILQNSASSTNQQHNQQHVEIGSMVPDFKNVKKFVLTRKYYDALGIMNKYSALMNTNDLVRFYFIWIKLHGAFYNNFLLDINKISTELSQTDPAIVGPANYYYVLGLLEACKSRPKESSAYFAKAVAAEDTFARFPIQKIQHNEPVSLWNKIKKVISS